MTCSTQQPHWRSSGDPPSEFRLSQSLKESILTSSLPRLSEGPELSCRRGLRDTTIPNQLMRKVRPTEGRGLSCFKLGVRVDLRLALTLPS